MDPREFLDLAQFLLAADAPAHNRSTVSRSYYAVYNTACEALQALGVHIERGHAGHERVRELLRHSGDDRLVHVGAQLRRLQDDRVKAGYWMRDPHPERHTTAERWVTHAVRMLANIDAVLADRHARERVTHALRVWEGGRNGG